MQLTPKQVDALKLLGVTQEEWWFVQGRYLEARKELEHLRLGVQRVAEMTRDTEVTRFIPAFETERGWNRLCAVLVDWIETRTRPEP
jgi:hypothetical protein